MIKKICAVFAVMACGLMIGNVNSVAWADVSVEKTDDDYSDVGVRSPRTIEGVPIDDGHKRDVNWDAKKKELTLNNYHGKGYIILDDLERNSNNNEIDSKREEAERLAHKNDVITIVVKGDCTIEGCLECECNLKITGDGSLSVIDEGEKDSEYEGTYTICTGDYFASDFSPAKCGNIEVSNITIKDTIFCGNNVTFNNVTVNRNFKLSKVNHDYGYDCFYAPFAVGESIVVNNSTMNFKYYAPKKNELNYYLNDLHCLDAKNIYINNSEIKFKGKKKAFTAYPSTPFGDNEISTQHIKNSKIVFRVGQCFRKGDYIYRINKINDGIITEASIHEAYWSRKKYTINKTVKAYGNKIKIVCIDKDAFKRSFKMKEVIIKSKGIKKIEKDAFARWPGVKGTIKFKVPKARKKLYSKLLKKAGTKKFVLK